MIALLVILMLAAVGFIVLSVLLPVLSLVFLILCGVFVLVLGVIAIAFVRRALGLPSKTTITFK